jgi:hypothetical protein
LPQQQYKCYGFKKQKVKRKVEVWGEEGERAVSLKYSMYLEML